MSGANSAYSHHSRAQRVSPKDDAASTTTGCDEATTSGNGKVAGHYEFVQHLSPRVAFASGKFDQYKRDIPYSSYPLAVAEPRLFAPI